MSSWGLWAEVPEISGAWIASQGTWCSCWGLLCSSPFRNKCRFTTLHIDQHVDVPTKWLKMQLTLELHGFELHRSVSLQLVFQSTCTTLSMAGWLSGCGITGGGLTVKLHRKFDCVGLGALHPSPLNICEEEKVNFHSHGNLRKTMVKLRREKKEMLSLWTREKQGEWFSCTVFFCVLF